MLLSHAVDCEKIYSLTGYVTKAQTLRHRHQTCYVGHYSEKLYDDHEILQLSL